MARQVIFSDLAVEAGLWYVLSLRFDEEIAQYLTAMSPDEIEQMAQRLEIDPQMKEDLAQIIVAEAAEITHQREQDQAVGLPPKNYSVPELEQVWARVVLGRYWAATYPATTIASAIYEKLRSREVAARGILSSQGVSRWPATCQTLTKRCGGSWNAALKSFGLATASRGRVRGALKFSEQTYPQAAANFLRHCIQVGKNPTVNYYSQWVAREKRQGRVWPSSAAQRQVHGTWLRVVAAGEEKLETNPPQDAN